MKRMVLFLCTGDTCRGPMAAGLTAKLLEDIGVKDIDVRSAGVMTVNGLLPTAETLQMLKNASVVLERHRSFPVSVDLLRKCDLILGMTPLHVQHALRMAPEIKGRVYLLKEFTRSDLKKVQIDDPMGNTLEVYKKVFQEIRAACQKFIKHSYVTGKDNGAAPKTARKRATAKKTPKKAVKKPAARKQPAATATTAKATATAKAAPAKLRSKAPSTKLRAATAAKSAGKAGNGNGASAAKLAAAPSRSKSGAKAKPKPKTKSASAASAPAPPKAKRRATAGKRSSKAAVRSS